jgi:hypothetical protein
MTSRWLPIPRHPRVPPRPRNTNHLRGALNAETDYAKLGVGLLDGPGRREAALRHGAALARSGQVGMSWSADPFIACSSNYGHGGVGSPVTSYRSQAARTAARPSPSTLGDLAGLPLLKSAPCSHFEQISTRGRDAALVPPICPQLGQMIRVSMSVTTAAAGAAARASRLRQQLRQPRRG